jgi:lipopolysaccharide export system permease protein
MRLPLTLSAYIGRRFLQNFGVVLVPISGVSWLIDTVDISRRAATRSLDFQIALEMSTFKLLHTIEDLIPFVVLLAAMMTFFRLTRDHELAVIRGAGVSIWQFTAPAIVLALVIGGLGVTTFNPVASALYARYEQMNALYFYGRPNTITLSPTGLWIRQVETGTTSIVHASRVLSDDLELSGITVFNFTGGDRFTSRIDAPTGRLQDGFWVLDHPTLSAPDVPSHDVAQARVPTALTPERIQGTLATPETVSFWDMPAFIQLLEAAGFPTVRHVFYWHRLVASPFLLIAIVLVAATFSLRQPRRGGAAVILGAGVAVGFMIFLVSNIVAAFGRGGIIPPPVAAWTPAVVWTLLATSALLHLEDG